MELNLRKASNASKQLLALANKITVRGRIGLSIYDETLVEQQIQSARRKAEADLKTRIELTRAAFIIRDQIGTANAQAGIDALITARASEEAILRILTTIRDRVDERGVKEDATTFNTVTMKIRTLRERAKSSKEGYGGVEEEVESEVFSKSEIDKLDEALRTARSNITRYNDELLEKNTTTKIRLNDDIVALLTKHQI